MKNRYRLAILTISLFLPFADAFAQMTDDQIISYALEQYAAGADKMQIASSLMARGVTMGQLQRLMETVKTSPLSTTSEGIKEIDRSREPAIQTKEVTSPAPVEEKTETKKIFGHDIFQSEQLTFQSNTNIPAPASYLLGPGDEIILDIYGSSQTSEKVKIAPDGSVILPKSGPVYLSGLTMDQARNKIRRIIGSKYQDSEIKISLGQTRTVIVNVMGEVMKPGSYSLSAFSTIFNALYLAGGINEVGTLRNIKLSRQGKVITTIDVYEFILNGNLPGNVMLQDDDVILVGTYDKLVNITGQVKRPMYYELKQGESLGTLLGFGGGYTGEANRDNIRIERKDAEGLTVHTVNEKDLASFYNEDADNVIVLSSKNRFRNTVSVEGAVFFPGNYRLGGNVTTVLSLIEQAGGLEEMAVTDLAVVLRLKEDRTLRTIQVPLGKMMNGKAEDIILQNEDKLIIASNSNRDALKKVTITGEVFNPGEIQYSEGETVASLITRAGGLKESADSVRIHIARRIKASEDDKNGESLATLFQVSKDDPMTLMPFDVVTITRSEFYKEQRFVRLEGEVKNSGAYALETAGERLSSVVMRAGGPSSTAFTEGAIIKRIMDNESTYTIGTDLAKALEKPGSTFDPVLKEGDVIIIPPMDLTVRISGAVVSPNIVNFKDGANLSYYLNQAGGVSRDGSRYQAYIIYANGTKSLARKGKIRPGCEIVVPAKKKEFNPQIFSLGLSSASVMASVAAVIANILR